MLIHIDSMAVNNNMPSLALRANCSGGMLCMTFYRIAGHHLMKNIRILILLIFCFVPALAHAGPVHHIVMIWFPDDTTAQQIDRVIMETRKLSSIPGVSNLKVGRAIASERDIVDDSFDIGISMQFPDTEAMNTYINHPKHIAFVNQYIKGQVRKLRIYDF